MGLVEAPKGLAVADLTQAEFEQIVYEEAISIARLENVSVQGWHVSFQVRARRTSWDASVHFDPVTAQPTIRSMYIEAVVPRILADNVRQRMLSALAQP